METTLIVAALAGVSFLFLLVAASLHCLALAKKTAKRALRLQKIQTRLLTNFLELHTSAANNFFQEFSKLVKLAEIFVKQTTVNEEDSSEEF